MRGIVPSAVGVPLGEISWSRSPDPDAHAIGHARADRDLVLGQALERAGLHGRRWRGAPSGPASLMPRTRAPDATSLAVAITWPVTRGVTETTPSVERRRAARSSNAAMPLGRPAP